MSDKEHQFIKREIKIMKSIHHPNIVKMLNFYNTENFYFIILEFMQGGELFERIVEKEFYTE